MSHSKDLSLIA